MNWLKQQARVKPGQKFINQLTFREVYEQVADLAGSLFPLIKAENRVALYSHNSVDMALFFLALQELEKEVLMVNTRLTGAEVEKQLNRLKIQKVFCADDKIMSIPGKDFIPFDQVRQGHRERMSPEGERSPEKKTISGEKVSLAGEYNPEQIAVIMNTSATSGEFKSVPLRWKQFSAHVEASRQSLGMSGEDNWLMVLPMYHISGLTILLRSLYNGTRVTIMDKFEEEAVIRLIEEGQVNMLSLVPTMLTRMIDRINRHHLRVVLLGGEFIPRPLVEKCIARTIPVYKTYGMTETTSQSATFSVLDHPDKIDSVGLPLEGVEILIARPDEEGIGEVMLKSPMLMDGYLDREPLGREFLNTEDIGYLDQAGFLFILDRRKNIIISGGENIYPKEIENILYAHPQIKECAVVGKKDLRWGQVPVLFVVSDLSEQEIIDYLAPRIARYKLPRSIIYLNELPRNGAGKVLTKDLAGRLAGE